MNGNTLIAFSGDRLSERQYLTKYRKQSAVQWNAKNVHQLHFHSCEAPAAPYIQCQPSSNEGPKAFVFSRFGSATSLSDSLLLFSARPIACAWGSRRRASRVKIAGNDESRAPDRLYWGWATLFNMIWMRSEFGVDSAPPWGGCPEDLTGHITDGAVVSTPGQLGSFASSSSLQVLEECSTIEWLCRSDAKSIWDSTWWIETIPFLWTVRVISALLPSNLIPLIGIASAFVTMVVLKPDEITSLGYLR